MHHPSRVPLISVVIPCYNYGHYLEATVRSVLVQSLRAIEIIIVDDGSRDDTFEIALRLAEEDNRIRPIRIVNMGVCVARNVGMALANADVLKFLDADDLLIPNCLEVQLEAMHRTGTEACACSMAEFWDEEQKEITLRHPGEKPDWSTLQKFHQLSEDENYTFNHLLISKAVVEDAGGFLSGLPAGEEGNLITRLKILGIPCSLATLPTYVGLLKRVGYYSVAYKMRTSTRGLKALAFSHLNLVKADRARKEPKESSNNSVYEAELYKLAVLLWRNHEQGAALDTAKQVDLDRLNYNQIELPGWHRRLHKAFGFFFTESFLSTIRFVRYGPKKSKKKAIQNSSSQKEPDQMH